jgi:hypothetical protein
MSRILDTVVHAIAACSPLCDSFTSRALILKVSEAIDEGYLRAVGVRHFMNT